MTPWSSPTFDDERSRSTHENSNWHSSHDLLVQSHSDDTTISATLGEDFQHFCTPISRHHLLDQHNLASQTTSRFDDTIVHAYHSSRSDPQHGRYIPAFSSSSQLFYPSGPTTPIVTGETWNEASTGGRQGFFQPLDVHTPISSSFLTPNFPPSHINGLPLPSSSPSVSEQYIPRGLMHGVHLDRQLPRHTAPYWQVRSADTSTPDFQNRHLSCPPPPSSSFFPYPHMGPNSGSGTLDVSYPCLWVENGIFCNVMVQATRSQMNRHLRTSHGFSGPETRLARCHWVGCGDPMQQGSIARHMVTCHLQAKVTCPRCSKKLSRADVMPKHQRICPAANR